MADLSHGVKLAAGTLFAMALVESTRNVERSAADPSAGAGIEWAEERGLSEVGLHVLK